MHPPPPHVRQTKSTWIFDQFFILWTLKLILCLESRSVTKMSKNKTSSNKTSWTFSAPDPKIKPESNFLEPYWRSLLSSTWNWKWHLGTLWRKDEGKWWSIQLKNVETRNDTKQHQTNCAKKMNSDKWLFHTASKPLTGDHCWRIRETPPQQWMWRGAAAFADIRAARPRNTDQTPQTEKRNGNPNHLETEGGAQWHWQLLFSVLICFRIHLPIRERGGRCWRGGGHLCTPADAAGGSGCSSTQPRPRWWMAASRWAATGGQAVLGTLGDQRLYYFTISYDRI